MVMDSSKNRAFKVVLVCAAILLFVLMVIHGLQSSTIQKIDIADLRSKDESSDMRLERATQETSLVVPVKSWRELHNEDPGPFLGMGDFPRFFLNFSIDEAQGLFHGEMVHLGYVCENPLRMGKAGDGGYYVCIQGNFRPKTNSCLVYSFGINNEWSFDEHMNSEFGCEVHSFDPSMKMQDHEHKPGIFFHNLGIWGYNGREKNNWVMKDLTTIIKELQHTDRIIDYLKIDVEGAEWSLVEHIVRSQVYKQIRQMVIEIHTPRPLSQTMTIADYGEAYMSFHKLKQVGLSKFMFQTNNNCCGGFPTLVAQHIYKKKLCCYELFFINTRFL